MTLASAPILAADELSSASDNLPLAERFPFTLGAITQWPNPQELMAKAERELYAGEFAALVSDSYRVSARKQCLTDIYANTGVWRLCDQPQREFWFRIVRTLTSRSPRWEAIAVGGLCSLQIRRAYDNEASGGDASMRNVEYQEAFKQGATLFDVVAVSLAASTLHNRQPERELFLTCDQLAAVGLGDDQSLSIALKVIHTLRVVKLRIPQQGRARGLPTKDIVRDVDRSPLGIRLALEPAFVRFLAPNVASHPR